MSDIKLVCLDDRNIPIGVPKSKYVKEGNEYTLLFIYWMPNQKCQGFELAEIEFGEDCGKYICYRGNRFGIRAEDLEAFLQMCKDCSQLDDLNIEQVLEETELQLIEN